MAVKIGSLFFDMRVGMAAWQRDMGRASKRLQRFGRSVGRVARQMSVFGGAVSGVGLVLLAHRSIEAADNIDKLSTRLGVSTEALSQYQHVAKLTGVQFNTLTMALQRMTRRVSEAASGTGEARDAIKELGLSAQALERLTVDQQFEVLADALMDVEDQTDRVRLAFKLFDSEGVAVLQTMEGGAAGIRAMREEADRLGKTLTREQTDKLVAAKDAWTRLGSAIEGIVQQLVIGLGPALAATGEWLAERLPAAIAWLKRGLSGMAAVVTNMVARITTSLGQLFIALVPLTSGDLQQKYREWALSMFEVAGAALEMNQSISRGLEVNMATVGRFDETLKAHAGTWEGLKTTAEAAGDKMAKALETAEEKLDGATLAGDALGGAIERVGREAISGQIPQWETLGRVATSVLQDIMREVIRTTARLLAMKVALGFAGGSSGVSSKLPGEQHPGVGDVAAGGRIAATPPGAARASMPAFRVEVNNYGGQPVQASATAGGARIDIGRQVAGMMGEELRRNPTGPLGRQITELLGSSGPAPFTR